MLVRLLLGIVFLFLFTTGCTPKYARFIPAYQSRLLDKDPDYANLEYWAAHPWKKNPADSVPEPLRKGYTIDSSVDVFFIHPTTLTDKKDNRWNADINDAAINAKTDYSTILYQASAFNEYRVFAPRYRQAHLRSYYTADTARALAAFDLAYQDIKAAFNYYLKHYNMGRPIVIAAHSQGSTHGERLLKEFMENSPLKNQLVVAYIAGMYIPTNYFSTLSICKDSMQTGCICGWRTFKQGYKSPYLKREKGPGLITNPLTGDTSNSFAAYTMNKGAVLKNFNKVRRNVAGAQIHEGVLWIDKLHMPGGFLVPYRNFHIGDINIFYVNIREDLKRRVTLYVKK